MRVGLLTSQTCHQLAIAASQWLVRVIVNCCDLYNYNDYYNYNNFRYHVPLKIFISVMKMKLTYVASLQKSMVHVLCYVIHVYIINYKGVVKYMD